MTATSALFPRRGTDDETATARKIAAACLGASALAGDITAIGDCSAPDAVFRWPDGAAIGPGAAMARGLEDLAAHPGAECLIEDVLHRATPPGASDDGPGLYVCARATILGRAASPDRSGPVTIPTMAEIWAQGGQIRDAWILRDGTAALAATGVSDLRGWAETRLAAPGPDPSPLAPDSDPEGPYSGRGARTDTAGPLADHLSLMMDGEMAEAARGLDPACMLHLPGGAHALGRIAAIGFWAGLRAALPAGVFRIEHALGAPAGGDLPGRAAVRWSLYGRHEGPGRFGPPSGAYIYVLGLTQAEFGPSGIRRLWTLFDDPSICLQTAARRESRRPDRA